MTQEILIGTQGWDDAAFVDAFYPQELPPEWRFCYYSNLLRAVLVPHTLWAGADVARAAQWRDDCDPAFRFVLELPPAAIAPQTHARAAVDAFLAAVAPLAAQIAGCIVRCDLAPVDASALAYAVQALGAHYPLCVQPPRSGCTPPLLAALGPRIDFTWDADTGVAPPLAGTLLVAQTAGGNPRALRAVLEQVATSSARQRALFFKPSPQAVTYALQARTLAEMMGI